jgi:ketosteroid isomerase-like protein
MSRANVELVKGIYAASAGGDTRQIIDALPELIQQICDPEIEWVEDPKRADGRTYRGHEGVLESFKQWFEQFDEYEFELEQVVDCGDRVLVTAREQGRGATSRAPVSARLYQVLTFRDGKVLRYQEFYDEQAALEAAELRE